MTPKHQNRRIGLIIFFGALLVLGSFLVYSALSKSAQFFYNPSEVLADGFQPKSAKIKVGGFVVPGSVVKDANVTTTFSVVDFPKGEPEDVDEMASLSVSYQGVLPDLFAEGEGVVVSGALIGPDSLIADEVLAKHDENYQPQK